MTIGKRLGWCFAGAGLMSAALGICAWFAVSGIAHELDNSVLLTAKKVALASELKHTVLTLRFSERGIVLFGSIHGEEKKVLNKNSFDAAKQQIASDMSKFRPLVQTSREAELLDVTQAAIKTYSDAQVGVYDLVSAGRFEDAIKADMQMVPAGTASTKATEELMGLQQAFYDQAVERADRIARTSRIAILAFLLLSAAVSVLGVFVLRNSTEELKLIASDMESGADQVTAAASQVSASSQSLAQGSSEQAASLEETSSSSEEINSMARRNTDNTRSMAALVGQSQEMFIKTNHQLEEMVVSMDEINQSSGKISKIIKVIDEIAFQTNILALNAAVEAARAGEAGMGFAVVADEVRNLAQRSAQAAKDTATLIEESISKSNGGKVKVDQVAIAIRTITEDSGKIKTLVDEVTLGSEEQTRGLEQIARAIGQMEQVTQTTAANAEESAAAAEELNAQSVAMKDVVAQLHAMVGGRSDLGGLRSSLGGTTPSIRRPAPRESSAFNSAKSAHSIKATRSNGGSKPTNGYASETAFPLEEAFKEF